ncbi:MAG: DUF3142 domain-containing protein [Acidobacteriaceae bacterium]|jgi:hypothetical protein
MMRSVLICLCLLSCARETVAGTVDASKYDAFWLWSGVRPQPVLDHARCVYVLQGQIEAKRGDDSQVRFIAQGVTVPQRQPVQVWLAYRVHTLHWTPREYAILLAQLHRWQQAGNKVVGVQIDFDAHTLHLQEYVEFLRQLRQHLPSDYRLGITGLLDWSSRADPSQVNQLRGVVDEVVVQTYQGRHTIENYSAYLPRVSQLNMPFRIGLIQGGNWDAPGYISESPWFRGYVVFLQNPRGPK